MMDMKHTVECSSILESHIRNINIYPSKFNCSVQSVLQPAPRLTNVVCIFRLSSLIIYRLILSIKFVKYMTKYARNRLYIYIYIYIKREKIVCASCTPKILCTHCTRLTPALNFFFTMYVYANGMILFCCICERIDE